MTAGVQTTGLQKAGLHRSMHDALSTSELAHIERRTQTLGREIFDRLPRRVAPIWNRAWWDERLMDWAIRDPAVKVQMFRLVDVLPMLDDSASLARHVHEYFADIRDRLPRALRMGLTVAEPGALAGRVLSRLVRAGALRQARNFIAGSNVEEVLDAVLDQRRQRRAFTLDILGEAVASQREADRYFRAYLDLIESVSPRLDRWPEVPQIDRDRDGKIPRTNISIKLSALDSQFDEIDPQGTTLRVARRLRELLRAARRQGAFLNVDMEAHHGKDLTLHIFKSVLAEEEFRDTPDVGVVVQCYLKDALADLVALRDWAERRGAPVWVRIVKGAYWDFETVHAQANRWPVPVLEEKWRTDANFENLSRVLFASGGRLRAAVASHNIRSLAHAMAAAEHYGVDCRDLELQMLYGMGDDEKNALVEMGYRLRVYMPYGQLIPGMAYLVRRLLENSSNESFLRASQSLHVPAETLLMNPLDQKSKPSVEKYPPNRPAPGEPEAPYWQTFENEPHRDFARAEARDAFAQALRSVAAHLGEDYPLVIGDADVSTADRLASRDPSRTERVVGTVASASADDARRAVECARAAWPAWAATSVLQRAKYLQRAADRIRERRDELAAWQVYECGKGWREADADVCEAIDFCRYYAQGAVTLNEPHGVMVAGEENEFYYLPRGVAAVIAPWNFPLAILAGMSTAALATGNTVVMKPAEQSSVVAARLMEVFREIDLPPGVVNFLPGPGETVGAALVEHPDVPLIAFTGSREVGMAIQTTAAEVSRRHGRGVKRVIAEMGGKNAILIDDDADLDEAVLGVVASAFAYQGQKCSACSRVVVLDSVYDRFLSRLVDSAASLQVGPAEDPAAKVGPVIDAASLEKIGRYIDIGRTEAREVLAVNVGPLADTGYFIGPHIFADVPPSARIAQEEIFGPVLAVIRAADLDEGIAIVNGTDYALTAGFYSRSPANLDRARREIQVGNLYLNRGCTGALVGRQPFGGFKMSGVGSKAGGPDYLLQFVVPKTVTENTMRRGFAPSDAS
jgi:RHH-type proline utilization regulon transcriptional repressor/proline dehydrogenase/delta 1-pyrroline-5-carboxylate dehydrogenase